MSRKFSLIAVASKYAPNLASPPSPHRNYNTDNRFLEVTSVNYDYIPSEIEAPKQLWVDLPSPAPENLHVGSTVRLHISPNVGIRTIGEWRSPRNSSFQVGDIIGSRIVLVPFRGTGWMPTSHSCSPFGWGYDTTWTDVRPTMHNTKYGYGTASTYLEYYPAVHKLPYTYYNDESWWDNWRH